MPGKVNPVMAEAVTQVAAQVYGNDAAVAFGGSQGNFELNVYMPMMARNLLESLRLLSTVSRLFADKCVSASRPTWLAARSTRRRHRRSARRFNPYIGYEAAGKDHQGVGAPGKSIRQIVLAKKAHDGRRARSRARVEAMTRGGIIH